jgi:multidrug efflux pump
MALTVATGFVVDDAIVVIENISRHLERGETPLAAALVGSRQIAFTIISLTLSLIAVLIPLLFMGDVVGRLFREFAVTLSMTILISAVVSLTLVPMLCAKLLRPPPPNVRLPASIGAEAAHGQRWYRSVVDGYGRMLSWVLDHRSLTLAVAVATLALTIALYVVVPKGFFPDQDTGLVLGITEAADDISYAAMVERSEKLADAILADDAVASLSSVIGIDGTNATLNSGRLLINIKPRRERGASFAEIMKRIAERARTVDGITLHLQPVQDLTIGAAIAKTQYQLVLRSIDAAELAEVTPPLTRRLAALPQLANVTDDTAMNGRAIFVAVDRGSAARFGISAATVDNVLYNAFGQRIISTTFTQSNQYRVILEAAPAFQASVQALQALHLPSATAPGGQVPLSAVATISEQPTALAVRRADQFPAATISFDVAAGGSLGAATQAIEATLQQFQLPTGVIPRFEGAALAFEATLRNQVLLILAAVVTMYIVLGVLYESFVHPVTILSTLPSAGIGALLALLIADRNLDIIAIIGIILLIGIVKKNAIMMVDFALAAERERGLAPRQAIFEACLLRLRPILMTTMTAVLAALPLMLGTGTGSELRQPLGLTIFGGLLVSQVLTLFTTPVIYLAFDDLGRRARRGLATAAGPGEEGAA